MNSPISFFHLFFVIGFYVDGRFLRRNDKQVSIRTGWLECLSGILHSHPNLTELNRTSSYLHPLTPICTHKVFGFCIKNALNPN
jgi:hypothetical protein